MKNCKNLFKKKFGKFLRPIKELEKPFVDSLYFLRNDGALIFSEGYLHPKDGIYGKIIYYPVQGNTNALTTIHGLPYSSTSKYVYNGKLLLTPHDKQKQLHFEIDKDLKNRSVPFYQEFRLPFYFKEFLGFFSPDYSLKILTKEFPSLQEAINSVSELLEVPIARMGFTGSLAFGAYRENEDDLDIIFYGSLEENKKIVKKIKTLANIPERRVFEFGKYWKIRFWHNKFMICSFFVYNKKDEIPLIDCKIQLIKDNIKFESLVVDDTHSVYNPPILKVKLLKIENIKLNSDIIPLIIMDGSLRGEFFTNDKVAGKAKLVTVSNNHSNYKALLVTISKNLF